MPTLHRAHIPSQLKPAHTTLQGFTLSYALPRSLCLPLLGSRLFSLPTALVLPSSLTSLPLLRLKTHFPFSPSISLVPPRSALPLPFPGIRPPSQFSLPPQSPLPPTLNSPAQVTLEATIEFIASALVPYVFPCVSSSASFDVPSLGAFCMRVYACTHACALCAALLFAPCILGSGVDKCDESSCLCTNSSESCGLLWTTNGSRHCCVESGFSREFCELPNSGGGTTCPLSYTSTAWLLSAVYCVCYCFLNQLGDAALEMAKTQWLDAFRGTELVPALVQ